jgi:outer membrane protein TolC
MKRFLVILSLLASLQASNAQDSNVLSIEDCHKLAKQNYPLIKRQALISKTKEYSIANLSTAFLPQFTVNGQATYQSDVTEIPVKLPNADITSISKDQYKIYAEVNQTIFDGGVNKLQKKSIEANAGIEQQQLEVELYKLNERINQLFFGVLLSKEQLTQTEMLKKDIQLGLDKVKAAIANGTALKSSGDALTAELLKAEQKTIELSSVAGAYIAMLSYFINKPLDENTVFEKPASPVASTQINRPELILFEKEKRSLDIQDQLVKAKNLPKAGLFLQGGTGKPALNMLSNDVDAYYIGGVRLNWSLSGRYTSKKEKALINIKRNNTDLQKETFLFNTELILKKQNADIIKLENLIKSDDEIIRLRTRIKNTALAQLEYGVINSSDYLREANAEDQARQSRLLHGTQRLIAQYDKQITTGN